MKEHDVVGRRVPLPVIRGASVYVSLLCTYLGATPLRLQL